MKIPELVTVTDEPPAPRPPETREVSTLAKASGIAGFLSFLGIVAGTSLFVLLLGTTAIICGHIARKRIRKDHESTRGSDMAMAGLILGYLSVCTVPIEWTDHQIVLNKARKVTTLATATALESAVNNFFTEYGKLPGTHERITTENPTGISLLTVLLGLEKTEIIRSVKFLAVREGKNHKNGLIYSVSGNSVEGLFDPWENPYTVILDTDYDEILRFKTGSKDVELKGRRIAVFSPGPDHKEGTSDDVRTW